MRRTPEGAVVRQRIPVGLEPSGHQIDFGVNWTKTIAPGGLWRVGAIVSHEPGHAAGRNPEAVFLVGLRLGL